MINALNQAYCVTCIPKGDDRLDTIIPDEYIGRKLEIIMLPIYDESDYNEETLAAMQETLDIMDGKIEAKSYATVEEMNADIDAEEDD